jgi:DDE superfamily endonuclease
VLLYPSAITLSTTHLRYVADLLRAHLRRIGSPWRKLTPTRQALLVLAHLRNGDTYQRLATGFGIGVATVYRYVREVTDLLAAHAPSLTAAVWRLAWTHNNFAILDGTVVRIDRIAADRPFYSGKHRHHGINLQGLTDPYGNLAWISDGLPGSVNDTAAARHHHILDICAQAGLLLLADTGYHNITDTPTIDNPAATVLTPYKNSRNQHTTKRDLPEGRTTANTAHAQIRGLGERGFATLKNWRILSRARCSTHRVTTHAKAILTPRTPPQPIKDEKGSVHASGGVARDDLDRPVQVSFRQIGAGRQP